jgi:heme oxygenase
MIPQGRRDLWLIPVVLAVLAWDGVGRRWRALVARLRPARLTPEERHLLREGARRARAAEWRG